MPLVEIIALGIAVVALIASLINAAQLVRLRAEPLPLASEPQPALPEPTSSPLEGLRVAIEIEQDHPLPVLANLLKERLLAKDVDVSSDEADLTIRGRLECNGYADIYYTAELECRSRNETICTWMEKPAHGDRPVNLANQIVTDLERELTKLISRSERRRALSELRSD